jgi:uncharacterized protein
MITKIILLLLKFYKRIISPYVPPGCRFLPSCSDYAAEAVQKHGPWRGGLFALKRLCRCHPWGGHGVDPVPPSMHCEKVP